MRILTGIIACIFISFCAVYGSFAGNIVDNTVCDQYNNDETQCNKTKGCYYSTEEQDTGCLVAPAGWYSAGDGYGKRECTNIPPGAKSDNYNTGNTTNDCYWSKSMSKGTIYRAKSQEENSPSTPPVTFWPENCPAGTKASGGDDYTVSYNGDAGLLGLEQSCIPCTSTDDDCNIWFLFLDNADGYKYVNDDSVTGSKIKITKDELFDLYKYSSSDSYKTTGNIDEDNYSFQRILYESRDGRGYDVACSDSQGCEFGLNCKYFRCDKDKNGTIYYTTLTTNASSQGSFKYFDTTIKYINSVDYEIHANIIKNPDGKSMILCAPTCTKSCRKGYYCDGTHYRTQCPGGLTTRGTSATSAEQCGIDGTTIFSDKHGSFTLPINGFLPKL